MTDSNHKLLLDKATLAARHATTRSTRPPIPLMVETDGTVRGTNGHILISVSPGPGDPTEKLSGTARIDVAMAHDLAKESRPYSLDEISAPDGDTDEQTLTLIRDDGCRMEVKCSVESFPDVAATLEDAARGDEWVRVCLGITYLEALIKAAKDLGAKKTDGLSFAMQRNRLEPNGQCLEVVTVTLPKTTERFHALLMPMGP